MTPRKYPYEQAGGAAQALSLLFSRNGEASCGTGGVMDEMARIRAVKLAHEAELMRKANVVGVGIGLRQREGKYTGEMALVVSVTHKVPLDELDPWDVIPEEIDGIPVDVQAVGTLRALAASGS